jgi:hypothetical protein
MEEVLVSLACLMKAKGCDQAAQAYYDRHPQIEELIRHQQRFIDQTVPPLVTQYIAPVAIITFDQTRNINLRLSKFISIGISKQKQTLLYKFDF